MKRFFYSIAFICSSLAFVGLAYLLMTSLPNLRNGLGGWVAFGMIGQYAPIAIALAVIPLCLAFAFDMATRE